jgi:hypothetical protein
MRERQGEREMKLWICNLHSSNLSVEREREREREREIGELRKRRNWVFAISILVTLSVASE